MIDTSTVDETLASARVARAPDAARARVRARLEAGGAFAGSSAAAGAGGAPSVMSALGAARSAVALLVGLGFGAGYWLGMHHPQAEPARAEPRLVAPQEAPAARAVPEPAAQGAPSPEPPGEPGVLTPASEAPASEAPAAGTQSTRVLEAPPRRAHRSAPPRAVPRQGFSDEVALLQRAERALRAGEPALALSFVEELERRYPESPFAEERGAARVMAECALQHTGASERAASFLRDRPASVYSDRVRQLCVSENADGIRQPGH
jgi:hypothetical protein